MLYNVSPRPTSISDGGSPHNEPQALRMKVNNNVTKMRKITTSQMFGASLKHICLNFSLFLNINLHF